MVKAKKIDKVVVVGYAVKQNTKPNLALSSNDLTLLGKEAIRVVNSIPDFTPGKIKGKNVAVYFTLPITFKLE